MRSPRLAAALAEPIIVGPARISIGASIGVTVGSGASRTTHLLRDADAAMYRAKIRHSDARPDERRGEHQRRQEVADLHVREVEQLQADPDDEHAAGAGQRGERLGALGEDVLEEARRRALIPPWTTSTVTAANATPGPSDAAIAIGAKPSSTAFVASAS